MLVVIGAWLLWPSFFAGGREEEEKDDMLVPDKFTSLPS